ncbi:hypothetical protein BCV69DRAFT_78249 [Microstroma glucosiphilum]|uniref:Secreted protein n=1 Tax=Pseudomicrostroma glucosiphilum TaxID=1684307 RepID=A0A316TYS3_9BASI|nr:hypothetical protein BCV69DRAFT_78249 [Pseudomicrostroma glucosiphilum]PWN18200.1 hypothetical protein BCV69DRAFT_78249 [Pseudomicrostroma glucosiphilum]
MIAPLSVGAALLAWPFARSGPWLLCCCCCCCCSFRVSRASGVGRIIQWPFVVRRCRLSSSVVGRQDWPWAEVPGGRCFSCRATLLRRRGQWSGTETQASYKHKGEEQQQQHLHLRLRLHQRHPPNSTTKGSTPSAKLTKTRPPPCLRPLLRLAAPTGPPAPIDSLRPAAFHTWTSSFPPVAKPTRPSEERQSEEMEPSQRAMQLTRHAARVSKREECSRGDPGLEYLICSRHSRVTQQVLTCLRVKA